MTIYVPWLAIGLVVFGIYWYLGQRSDTDVDAILDTLSGVPTDEYSPRIADEPTLADD